MRREPTFDDPDWGEDEPGLRRLEHPRPFAKTPFAKTRFAARFVVAAALIAGLSVAAKHKMHPTLASGPWAEPPRPAASLARAAVAGPNAGPLLKLDPSEGEPLARSEPPRWSPATGLREDALIGGGFDAIEAPFLRVTLTETVPTTDPPASLFVTLARRAAEMQGEMGGEMRGELNGLSVIRTGVRGQVETKFGPFEIVEATLSGVGQHSGRRACTGFQSLGARNLRIDGWLCGVLGQAPEPRALACTIDRLTLSGPAAPTVESAFQDAETRRNPGCRAGEPARSQRSEATGSIGPRKGGARAEAKGRPRKNEAQMRQIVQAEQ